MNSRLPFALIALAPLLAGCLGSGGLGSGPWDKDTHVLPLRAEEVEAPAPTPRLRKYVELLPNEDGSTGQIRVKAGKTTRTLMRANQVLDFENPKVDAKLDDGDEDFRFTDPALPAPEGRFLLYFENDTAELTAPSKEWLPEILATLAKRPAADIRVTGHADRFGDDRHNDELAARRAEAVRDAIVAAGIEAASLEIEARGEKDPQIETADGVREPKNRRAEIVVW